MKIRTITRRRFLTGALQGLASLSAIGFGFLGMKGWPDLEESEIQVSELEYGKSMPQAWLEEMHAEMRKTMVIPQHMLVSKHQWEILTDTTRELG